MKILLIAAALALLTVACAGRKEASGDAGSARELYRRHCAACHGPDGEGKQLGALRAPSFKRDQAVAMTDEQLYTLISRGSSNMPAFKNILADEQIAALVRHIREDIQGRK